MTSRVGRYFKLMLSVALFVSLARAYFIITNIKLFKSDSYADIIYTLFKGLYSDVPVILALNIIFTIIYFFPKTAIFQNKKISVYILSVIFWIINLPVIFLSFFNGTYYSLAGHKIESLSYTSLAQIGVFTFNLPLLFEILMIIVFMVWFYMLTKKYFFSHKEVYTSVLSQLSYLLFFAGVSAHFFSSNFSHGLVNQNISEQSKVVSLDSLQHNYLIALVKKLDN